MPRPVPSLPAATPTPTPSSKKAPPPPPRPAPRPAGSGSGAGTGPVAGNGRRERGGKGRRRSPWRWLTGVAGEVADAAREALGGLGAGRALRRLHEFADLVVLARAPERV